MSNFFGTSYKARKTRQYFDSMSPEQRRMYQRKRYAKHRCAELSNQLNAAELAVNTIMTSIAANGCSCEYAEQLRIAETRRDKLAEKLSAARVAYSCRMREQREYNKALRGNDAQH